MFAVCIAIYGIIFLLGPILGPLVRPWVSPTSVSHLMAPIALVGGLIFLTSYLLGSQPISAFSRVAAAHHGRIFVVGTVIPFFLYAILLIGSELGAMLVFIPIPEKYARYSYLVMWPLAVAMGEEAFFRGYLADFLEWMGIGRVGVVLVVSMLFSWGHITRYDMHVMPVIAFLASIALMLGKYYYDSLAWPIGFHFALNLCAAVVHGDRFVPGFEGGAIELPINQQVFAVIDCVAMLCVSIWLLWLVRQRRRS